MNVNNLKAVVDVPYSVKLRNQVFALCVSSCTNRSPEACMKLTYFRFNCYSYSALALILCFR